MLRTIRTLLVLSFCLGNTISFAQLILVPIERTPSPSPSKIQARTEGATLTLPFWDDFSDATEEFPKETLWSARKSVWVNTGMGINPPSLKVATFDGLDSLGKPYSVNDVLAKGFADKLISLPIDMTTIGSALRSSVFISFFYQFQGNGEAPDDGDIFSLSFLTKTGAWETVWTIENDGTLNKDAFVQVLVPITDDKFYHDKFQFRFLNFARLSGPYDTWNLDYVYLNKGRTSFDNSYPDRAITSALTNLFSPYSSLPIKHFLTSPEDNLTRPSFDIYNLRIGNNQPLNYFSSGEIKNYVGGDPTLTNVPLDNAQDIGSLQGLQRKTATLQALPPSNSFDPNSDSIFIKLNVILTTKDNVLIPANGDYDPDIYAPIDFRINDNINGISKLTNYYAYDDGSAEYGAGLGLPGAQLAYEFDMATTQMDTLVAVKIYFPRFGDESNQVIRLQIWNDDGGKPGSLLYQENITVERSQNNIFKTYPLSSFVGVKGKFFVGWTQPGAASVPVGLDKSGDSGSKVQYNTNGVWEKNTAVAGNLMIRPVFGKGKNIIVGLEKSQPHAYPNPTQGTLYLPEHASSVSLIDLSGRNVNFDISPFENEQRLTIQNAISGIYILRYQLDGKMVINKILVSN